MKIVTALTILILALAVCVLLARDVTRPTVDLLQPLSLYKAGTCSIGINERAVFTLRDGSKLYVMRLRRELTERQTW